MKDHTVSRSDPREPVLREYARLAARYDGRWSFYIRATTRETISRLGFQPTDALLDVGCGTGALLLELASSNPQVRLAGVDPSPAMLEIARNKLPPTVKLKTGWAEQIPFEDEKFDAVVSCNVFHYVREPRAALGEMARVLKPGGQLVITDWCDDYLACRICDVFLRRFSPAHFRIYGAKECRRLIEEAAWRNLTIERYKISWLWGLMTARARKQEAP